MTAHQLIGRIVDTGSFVRWDRPLDARPADPGYRAALARARERSGLDEAVTTGRALLAGRPVALIASEFAFLGGSIGVATAERITLAVERATAERLPLVALPVSGGTRMQEGAAAFLCMVRVTAAVQAHQAAGLPYLTYLRNPTMGGVFASWGTLGHLVLAEPGARLGFLGPRVYEQLRGEPLPPDVQLAETLAARGLLDAVVPQERLREVLRLALDVLAGTPTTEPAPPAPAPRPSPPDPWDAVRRTRRTDRPGARQLLDHAGQGVLTLAGEGALVRALARFGGRPAVVVGQQRQDGDAPRPFTAAELRLVRRSARMAEQLGLPLVTLVDTAGAELSARAELDGIAVEIAQCLATLVGLATPVLAVLLGQGSGGGALALLPADRVLAAEHAWLAPLPPEGASAIVHRDGDHAAELARAQGIGAADLAAAGLVDQVIAELPDAAEEPAAFCARVGAAVAAALTDLAAQPHPDRLRTRAHRHRHLGGPPPTDAG
ncbi:carboxyl transferase domain-containing protein [Kitasatospora sp. MBT63]|uniref:carboxyl transferase domain-containing protein n=1 Tax=Kitasatospora sp. MBT63 TaxID=1444768 RepID=UPI00053AC0B3|nr:carboxyl transferase domain-containing protein [Kitasatospora sp. MBT63]